ncbi:MAG: cell wall-binding repeat-containing protein [Ruminococcus sp.]|nr:cell wall-binding repeat-containing protein [Ruminococcus sp.]
MKKKILASTLAICLAFGSSAYLPAGTLTDSTTIKASAGDVEPIPTDLKGVWNGFQYRSGMGGIMITGYTGSKADITIPDKIEGYSVSAIDRNAFKGNTTIKSLKFENIIFLYVLEGAFKDCSNLETIDFSGMSETAAKLIADDAFEGTKWLTEQRKKNPLVVIGSYLYNAKTASGSVTIPSGVKALNASVFKDSKVTSITIPAGVESFYGNPGDCTTLKSVSAASGNKYFVSADGMLFDKNKTKVYFCDRSKKTVTIPGTVTTIGIGAFKGCVNLTKVEFPKSVTGIEDEAFMDCKGLTEIYLPDNLNYVWNYAFLNCPKLKEVTLAKRISLGTMAFGYTYDSKTNKYKAVEGFALNYKDGSSDHGQSDDTTEKPELISGSPVRLAGSNRFSTAAEISKATYEKADTVILAYGLNYADALAGVPLAYQNKAPILLTNTKELDADTLKEIKRLGAKNVIIIGGEGVVGKEIESALAKEKISSDRIAGKSRFSTATQIARKLNPTPEEVFFVYGLNSADALSAGAAAAVKNAPIIYLTKDGELNADTAEYLAELKKAGCVKKAYVIGGEGVITNAMMNKAAAALGLKSAQRISGKNRYDTCIEVAKTFRDCLNAKGVCVAKGLDFPDALAGGVFAAVNKMPLFLADNKLTDNQKKYLDNKSDRNVYVFGGTGAVPVGLAANIKKELSGSDSIPGASADTIRILCWNSEFKLRFDEVYPKYGKYKVETGKYQVEVEDGKTETLSQVTKINGKKVEWVNITSEHNAYQNRLDADVAVQKNADMKVDMFLMEGEYAQKYVGLTGDRSVAINVKDLGITDNDTKNMFAYTKDIGTANTTGELKALSWQSYAGAFAFNTKIAKEVLGTDDPAKVQEYVKDWDTFKQTAAKMKTKGYKMLSSTDDTIHPFLDSRTTSWVVDGKLNIDANMTKWIEQGKEFTDNGYNNQTFQWAPEWNDGMKDGAKVFGYFFPKWGVDFTMSAYSSNGNWKITQGPAAWYWGGTWLCAAEGTDNKDIVADIIKTVTCDQRAAADFIKNDNEMPNNKAAIDAVKNTYKNEFLGGQNDLAVYAKNAEKISLKNVCSAYDTQCTEAFMSVSKDYFNGFIAYNDLIKSFKEKVHKKYPQIKV